MTSPDSFNYDPKEKMLYSITPFRNYKISTNETEYFFLKILLGKNVTNDIIEQLCQYKFINPGYFESNLKSDNKKAIEISKMLNISVRDMEIINAEINKVRQQIFAKRKPNKLIEYFLQSKTQSSYQTSKNYMILPKEVSVQSGGNKNAKADQK